MKETWHGIGHVFELSNTDLECIPNGCRRGTRTLVQVYIRTTTPIRRFIRSSSVGSRYAHLAYKTRVYSHVFRDGFESSVRRRQGVCVVGNERKRRLVRTTGSVWNSNGLQSSVGVLTRTNVVVFRTESGRFISALFKIAPGRDTARKCAQMRIARRSHNRSDPSAMETCDGVGATITPSVARRDKYGFLIFISRPHRVVGDDLSRKTAEIPRTETTTDFRTPPVSPAVQ